MNGLPASVLFACSENSIRSPMAEALAKRLYGQASYIDSVGVRASDVDSFVVAALDEIGIDVHRHHAKTFDDVDPSSFDLIVTLSPEAHHRRWNSPAARRPRSNTGRCPTPAPSRARARCGWMPIAARATRSWRA